MSSKKSDVEQLLEALADIQNSQVVKQTAPPPAATNSQIKVAIISVALASILPIGGVIYQMGSQKQELFAGIDKVQLEVEKEFTKDLSDYKDYINKEVRELESEMRDVVRENHNLKMDKERSERKEQELEDRIKDLERSDNDQYRNIQYLKSQHSINVPPQ